MIFGIQISTMCENKKLNYLTGPSLKKGRQNHGCALMKKGKTPIIVAGGWGGLHYLSSVEIIDPSIDNNQWTQGK